MWKCGHALDQVLFRRSVPLLLGLIFAASVAHGLDGRKQIDAWATHFHEAEERIEALIRGILRIDLQH